MIVLCFLPSRALDQLRQALPAPNQVSNAATWDDLVSSVRDRRCDVAVVDPCTGAEHLALDRVHALTSAHTCPSVVAVVAYVSVTAATIRAIPGLVRLGAAEIVVRGVDDTVAGLQAVVNRALAACAATRVVSGVGMPLQGLPPSVARALELLFRRPEQLRSVSDLAMAARMTRRSLDRCLARAGLSPARTLLTCARANAAFHLLAGGSVRKAQAAALLGYPSSRSLSRELYEVTGCPASAIPSELSREAFVAALGRRLVRTTVAPAAVVTPY